MKISPMDFVLMSAKINPYLVWLAGVFIFSGLLHGLFIAEADYAQQEPYRFIYIHVPSVWLSLISYTGLGILSFVYLLYYHPMLPVITKTLSAMGVVYTLLALMTGSLWGKEVWGAYWVWDASLTSMFVLLLLYLSYILMSLANPRSYTLMSASSMLATLGLVNLPIIKYSVVWWSGLHQSESMSSKETAMHYTMMYPLMYVFMGLVFLSLLIIFWGVRAEIMIQKLSLSS